jgi:hypothetical protein
MDADRIPHHFRYFDPVHGDHRGHQYLTGETGKVEKLKG